MNLIIFDEAHHILKKNNKPSFHPYRRIMDIYKDQTANLEQDLKPRILGLTASIFNSQIKMDKFYQNVAEIQEIYDAKVESENTKGFFKEAQVFVEISDNAQFSPNLIKQNNQIESIEKVLNFFEGLKEDKETSGYNLVQSLANSIEKVKDICFKKMGPWFAIDALKIYGRSVSHLAHLELSKILINLFEYIQNEIKKHCLYSNFSLEPDFSFKHEFYSAKINSFLKLLVIFRNHLNCIVFVHERIEANLIYRFLLLISQKYEKEFGFLKPGFICGSPIKDFIRFDKNTTEFKRKFETKQLNVIIATSVLEEGIDVPVCNIVIRYDFPLNFRAFIQSKGRARDSNSYYLLMVENNESQNWKSLLAVYHKGEQELIHFSSLNKTNDIDNCIEVENSSVLYKKFLTEIGAELNEKDSLRLLHKYLQNLPSDYFTESRPNFIELEKNHDSNLSFRCLFILPSNSSLFGIVKGEYCSNKKAAKLNCAFQVCQRLYKEGELDAHLNIISKKFLLQKHFKELNLKIVDRSKLDSKDDLNSSKAIFSQISSIY